MPTPRAPGDDQPVRAIGRYEFVSEIAPGALGELWKARIVSGPELGRVVAIRRVPRTAAFDANAVERLTNAGFAAMEVRHPKIAAVLDVVVAETEIALVSEYIGGCLLQSLLRPSDGKRPNVSPEVGLRIVLDVLEALDAVRSQWRDLFPSLETEEDRVLASGVHGGLVPDSVLIASFGEAMLLDAGLAGVAMTMHPVLDHADVVAYRAPEQLDAGGPADERADVFTAAVLLWELLAARPLFAPAMLPRPATTGPGAKTKAFSDAMQVSTVRRKVLSSPIQRLDALPLLKGRVTKAYADIVARCLERDPAKRVQTVREVIDQFTDLGPKAVAGYDAVSRLLASVGAAPPSDETPVEPTSGRRTSNRPTLPPDRSNKDSVPPDTRRKAVDSEATTGRHPAVAALRAKLETPQESQSATPVEDLDLALTAADIQSIPPAAPTESILPPSTDIESLPPSGEPRAMSFVGTASVDMSSSDVESLPPSDSARTDGSADRILMPFASALAPPLGAPSLPVEETTSAPVVRAVESDEGPGLASTMSSRSGSARNRKVVLGVVVAAGVLALVGLLRVAMSGRASSEPPSASAASSAAPSPPVETAPPEAVAVEASAEPMEQAAPAATAAPSRARAPTSAPPPPAPAGTQEGPAAKRQQPPAPKKKPYRPIGI